MSRTVINTTTDAVEALFTNDMLVRNVDDFPKFMMGISDGVDAAICAAEDPELTAGEIVARSETLMDVEDIDYLRGAFLGALATPHLLSKIAERGAQDV